jgi:hypothetical protein
MLINSTKVEDTRPSKK